MTRTFWAFIYTLVFISPISEGRSPSCTWYGTQESSSSSADNNVSDSLAENSDDSLRAQKSFIHAYSSQLLDLWPMRRLQAPMHLLHGSGSDGEAHHGSWVHPSGIDAEESSGGREFNLAEGHALAGDTQQNRQMRTRTYTASSESHGLTEGSLSTTAYHYPIPLPPPLPPPFVSWSHHSPCRETLVPAATVLAASHDSFYETDRMDRRGCRKREHLRRQAPSEQSEFTTVSPTQTTLDASASSSSTAAPSDSAPGSDSVSGSSTTVVSQTSSDNGVQISSVSITSLPISTPTSTTTSTSAISASTITTSSVFSSTSSPPMFSKASTSTSSSMASTASSASSPSTSFSTSSSTSISTSSSPSLSTSSDSAFRSPGAFSPGVLALLAQIAGTSDPSATSGSSESTSTSSISSAGSTTESSGSVSTVSSTSSTSASASSSSSRSVSSTASSSLTFVSSSLSSQSQSHSTSSFSSAPLSTTFSSTAITSSSSVFSFTSSSSTLSFSSSSAASFSLSSSRTRSAPDESSIATTVFTATETVTTSSTVLTSFTSTFTTTQFSTVTFSNGQTSLTPTNTQTVVTSGVLSTNSPLTSGNAFARDKGAIIGVAIGSVVALVVGVVLMFFLCGRWRSRTAAMAMAEDSGMREQGRPFMRTGSLATRLGLGLGGIDAAGLARDGSGSANSRQVLNRNYSSTSTTWRPPLSGEDEDEEFSVGHLSAVPQLPHSLGYPVGVGIPVEDGGMREPSASGHDHGSLNGHGTGVFGSSMSADNAANISRSGSVVQMQQQQAFNLNNMPGFGQAAESMAASAGDHLASPSSPLFSSGSSPTRHSFGPGPDPGLWYATGLVGNELAPGSSTSPALGASASSHGHSSASVHEYLHRSGSTLTQQRTATTPGTSSSSSHSHSNSDGHGGVMIPKLKLNEAAPPSSFKDDRDTRRKRRASETRSIKDLVSRLRGGRNSTQGSAVAAADSIPAASSFYPPALLPPGGSLPPSSLLNPPLPPHLARPKISLSDLASGAPWSSNEQQGERLTVHEGVARMWPQVTLPSFPSPAITEDSERLPEGLLNPDLAVSRTGSQIGFTPRPSLGSLRDHVDYSRPFSGLVFNRMDSLTSFATTTDTTHHTPALETPNAGEQDQTGSPLAY